MCHFIVKRKLARPRICSAKRKVFDPCIQWQLEREFRESPYLAAWQRKALSEQLAITERQVRVWFQNRRMRDKKLQQMTTAYTEELMTVLGIAEWPYHSITNIIPEGPADVFPVQGFLPCKVGVSSLREVSPMRAPLPLKRDISPFFERELERGPTPFQTGGSGLTSRNAHQYSGNGVHLTCDLSQFLNAYLQFTQLDTVATAVQSSCEYN